MSDYSHASEGLKMLSQGSMLQSRTAPGMMPEPFKEQSVDAVLFRWPLVPADGVTPVYSAGSHKSIRSASPGFDGPPVLKDRNRPLCRPLTTGSLYGAGVSRQGRVRPELPSGLTIRATLKSAAAQEMRRQFQVWLPGSPHRAKGTE